MGQHVGCGKREKKVEKEYTMVYTVIEEKRKRRLIRCKSMAKERHTTRTIFFLAASAILAAAGLFMLVKGAVGAGIGCLVAGLLGVLMHFHSKKNS
jgi:hypothetical protein